VIEEFLRELLGGRSGKDYPGCKGRGAKDWVCWWDVVVEGEYKRRRYRVQGEGRVCEERAG